MNPGNSQFLEITVRYVVTTPIWDSVELDTMRELHTPALPKLSQSDVRRLLESQLANTQVAWRIKFMLSAQLVELDMIYRDVGPHRVTYPKPRDPKDFPLGDVCIGLEALMDGEAA